MSEDKTVPEGMYFVMRSRLNGLVIDVKGDEKEDLEAGATLFTCERNEQNENQLWYEDQVTGTIRCKTMHDLCITITEEKILKVEEYIENNSKQEWVIAKDRIQNKNDPKLVISIEDGNNEPGARICDSEFCNNESQLWDIEYQEAVYFYIESELHGKVVTVKHAEKLPDAKIVIEPKREGAPEQLWHEGKHGFVRSKLNNFVLESKKDDEVGTSIRLMPFEPGNTKQLWCRHRGKIISLVHPRNLLAIKDKKKSDGAKLVISHDHNLPSQRWKFEDEQQ